MLCCDLPGVFVDVLFHFYFWAFSIAFLLLLLVCCCFLLGHVCVFLLVCVCVFLLGRVFRGLCFFVLFGLGFGRFRWCSNLTITLFFGLCLFIFLVVFCVGCCCGWGCWGGKQAHQTTNQKRKRRKTFFQGFGALLGRGLAKVKPINKN